MDFFLLFPVFMFDSLAFDKHAKMLEPFTIDASMLPKPIHLCQLYAGSHPKCQALQDEIRTWNITVSFIQYTWIE